MIDKHEILKRIYKTNPLAPYILKRCDFQIHGDVSYCQFIPKKNSYIINIALQHTKSLLEATFVGQHEMLHIVLRSHYYEKYNHELQNLAQDAIINQYLIEQNTDYIDIVNNLHGITLNLINQKYNTSFILKDTTWQDIYKILDEKKDTSFKCIDRHTNESESEKEKTIKKSILNKIADDSKYDNFLKSAGEAFGILSQVSQDEKIKKNALLTQKINSFFYSNKSFEYKRSIKRPSKRLPVYPFGRVKKYLPKLLICIDTSGSMYGCEKEIGMAIGIALKLGYQIDISWGSDKEYGFLENIKKIPTINIGEGCDNDVGFFKHRVKNYDTVLVITDAIAKDPNLNINKTLFILTQKTKWVTDKYKYIICDNLT